jgi:hypothetical protein
VRRRHGAATGDAAHDPLEQGTELVPHRRPARAAVAFEQGLHPLPDAGVHDSRVFAVVDLVLVARLADVGDVGE